MTTRYIYIALKWLGLKCKLVSLLVVNLSWTLFDTF